MELLKLDANNQASKPVENWDSLIWTERFNTVGDFQIDSGNVDYMLNMLPEGTVISLRESNVAMVVEDHKIDRKKNTPQKITVVGRSYESILDRRVAIQSVSVDTGAVNWTVNTKTPSDLAYYLIKYICIDGTLSANDKFPTAKVLFNQPLDYQTSSGPNKAFDVSRGNLLATVLGLLQTETVFADTSTNPVTPKVVPHGIRAVRPNGAGTAVVIEIYAGVDKTGTVYFDGTRDLLDDGTYLFSKKNSANAAYGVGQGMAARMFEGAVEPSGLDRRVILVDASTSGISDSSILRTEISQSLSEAHETAIFDGSINQDLSPYVYGSDYNLGDIVRVVGDYGLDEKARVTEYIRSSDATGVKSYPTLSALPT